MTYYCLDCGKELGETRLKKRCPNCKRLHDNEQKRLKRKLTIQKQKDPKDLERIVKEAKAAGMTYGKYVLKMKMEAERAEKA